MLKVKEITKNETTQRHALETHASTEYTCKQLIPFEEIKREKHRKKKLLSPPDSGHYNVKKRKLVFKTDQ